MTLLRAINPFRSLFARIFYGFWGMLLVMVLLIGYVLSMASGQDTEARRAEQIEEIQSLRDEVLYSLSIGDTEDVLLLLDNAPPHLRDQFRIYDETGFELLDRYEEVQTSFFRPALKETAPIFHDEVSDEFGDTYEVFVRLRPRLNLFESRHPSGVFVRILLALIVSFVGCYFLASSLTKPIRQLQWRARKITQHAVQRQNPAPLNLPDMHHGKDELGILAQDIDDMTKQLQQNVRQKQQLLQDIAHDLRGPLSRQSIALDMLRMDKPEQFEQLKSQLLHDHQQLTDLVEQTLNWFRHRADTLELSKIDLNKLCANILQDAQFEFEHLRFSLRAWKTELLYLGDENLLKSALENIVRNAGRFAKSRVRMTLVNAKRHVYITIEDNGKGVPEDELARIFEPFAQVDSARTPSKKKGAGLGLAIAQQAIHRHDGRITAENDVGLVVTIQLPHEP